MVQRRFLLNDGRCLETGEEIQRYPGKRTLVHGRIDGRAVVAKFYHGLIWGWWEWYRGLRGARALAAAPIVPSPRLEYSGFMRTANAWLAAIEYIAPDRPWPPTEDSSGGASFEEAHELVIDALASHHQAGIAQQDLNWTNFVPVGDCLYSIDGDRVRAHGRPLTRRTSLSNLARFYAYKADFRVEDIRRGYALYCARREWNQDGNELEQLLSAIFAERRRLADRFVRRSLKGWKHFPRRRIGQWHCIRDRRRLSAAGAAEIHQRLEREGLGGAGRACTTVDGSCRLRPFRTPTMARKAWGRSLLLRRLRIPVERPAALLELGALPALRRGALATCQRPHTDLETALREASVAVQGRLIERIGEILGLLRLAGLYLPGASPRLFGVDEHDVLLLAPELVENRQRPDYKTPAFEPRLRDELAACTDSDAMTVAKLLEAGIARVTPRSADAEHAAA